MTEELLSALVLAGKGVSQSFRLTLTTNAVPETSLYSVTKYPESLNSQCVACMAFLEPHDFLGYIRNF